MSSILKIRFKSNDQLVSPDFTRVNAATYAELTKVIETRFPNRSFVVTYEDDEKDPCSISNDDELKEARSFWNVVLNGKLPKLMVDLHPVQLGTVSLTSLPERDLKTTLDKVKESTDFSLHVEKGEKVEDQIKIRGDKEKASCDDEEGDEEDDEEEGDEDEDEDYDEDEDDEDDAEKKDNKASSMNCVSSEPSSQPTPQTGRDCGSDGGSTGESAGGCCLQTTQRSNPETVMDEKLPKWFDIVKQHFDTTEEVRLLQSNCLEKIHSLERTTQIEIKLIAETSYQRILDLEQKRKDGLVAFFNRFVSSMTPQTAVNSPVWCKNPETLSWEQGTIKSFKIIEASDLGEKRFVIDFGYGSCGPCRSYLMYTTEFSLWAWVPVVENSPPLTRFLLEQMADCAKCSAVFAQDSHIRYWLDRVCKFYPNPQ